MGNKKEDEITKGIGRKKKLIAAKMPTTNHLLVIGIDKYSNGVPPLNNAVRDAQAFRKILNEKYDFEEENIRELYDEEATGINIITAFDHLFSKLGKDDNLIFYFSGHGDLVDHSQRGYWLPYDAILQNRHSYISNSEIQDFIRSCRARHVLGIVDACYAGLLLFRKVKSNNLDKYYTKESRKIMTSGQKEPVPDGPPNTHSPFAAALLSALEYNTAPYCSTQSIWSSMEEGLEYNTYASPVYEPISDSGHQGGEFFFINKNSERIPEEALIEEPIEYPIQERSNSPKSISLPEVLTSKSTTDSISNDDTLVATKKRLRKLVVKGIGKAFEELDDILDDDGSVYNSLILLQGRYNSLRGEMLRNTISTNDSNVRMNQIRYSLLSYIDDLEEDDLK